MSTSITGRELQVVKGTASPDTTAQTPGMIRKPGCMSMAAVCPSGKVDRALDAVMAIATKSGCECMFDSTPAPYRVSTTRTGSFSDITFKDPATRL